MSSKVKKITEDLILNKLNDLVIWSYMNLCDTNYQIVVKSVDFIVTILEKLNLINRRIK